MMRERRFLDEILPAPVAWVRLPWFNGEPLDLPPGCRIWGNRPSMDDDVYILVEHGDLPMIDEDGVIPTMRVVWQAQPAVAIWDVVI
jgi:hypothetical protein